MAQDPSAMRSRRRWDPSYGAPGDAQRRMQRPVPSYAAHTISSAAKIKMSCGCDERNVTPFPEQVPSNQSILSYHRQIRRRRPIQNYEQNQTFYSRIPRTSSRSMITQRPGQITQQISQQTSIQQMARPTARPRQITQQISQQMARPTARPRQITQQISQQSSIQQMARPTARPRPTSTQLGAIPKVIQRPTIDQVPRKRSLRKIQENAGQRISPSQYPRPFKIIPDNRNINRPMPSSRAVPLYHQLSYQKRKTWQKPSDLDFFSNQEVYRTTSVENVPSEDEEINEVIVMGKRPTHFSPLVFPPRERDPIVSYNRPRRIWGQRRDDEVQPKYATDRLENEDIAATDDDDDGIDILDADWKDYLNKSFIIPRERRRWDVQNIPDPCPAGICGEQIVAEPVEEEEEEEEKESAVIIYEQNRPDFNRFQTQPEIRGRRRWDVDPTHKYTKPPAVIYTECGQENPPEPMETEEEGSIVVMDPNWRKTVRRTEPIRIPEGPRQRQRWRITTEMVRTGKAEAPRVVPAKVPRKTWGAPQLPPIVFQQQDNDNNRSPPVDNIVRGGATYVIPSTPPDELPFKPRSFATPPPKVICKGGKCYMIGKKY